MAYHVQHLHSAQALDDAINREGDEGDRLVVVRFGRGGHADCARLDAAMAAAPERIGPAAALYAVDTDEVCDFNDMYQLFEPCTAMFFCRYRHVDVRGLRGRGRHAIDWAAYSADGFAGLVEAVHKRAKAGRFSFIIEIDD